ncbi:hypothetical protein RRG08_023829 [Elysia crispata]|uniref:Uncharacterized protein n=1 Tax=Elysia crispata TaxID=231223 RepID=A0AAE1DN48_9GAST|nr:hypothetical protein RRG08_023829 [Elysia crispata]
MRKVCSLLDCNNVTRLQRRTALIAKELAKYNIYIAAISEIQFSEEGSVSEPESSYIFFWKGETQNEDRLHGVRLAHLDHLSQADSHPPHWHQRETHDAPPLDQQQALPHIIHLKLTSAEEVKGHYTFQ